MFAVYGIDRTAEQAEVDEATLLWIGHDDRHVKHIIYS